MPAVKRHPSRAALLTEPPRAGLDVAALAAAWPLLAAARRGDGHPVLVLPGFFATDAYTIVLRGYLRALGYKVQTWGAGRNWGRWAALDAIVVPEVERVHAAEGRKVSLVGASMGGLYAQELARAAPGSVRGLVTLGTPVVRSAPWVRTASGIVDGGTRLLRGAAALPRPWAERGSLRVPATSVYTRADGIVHWSSCRYEVRARRENVEVRGSHLGLACNPAVLWLLADRLGMAEGTWTPFRPPSGLSLLFPRRR